MQQEAGMIEVVQRVVQQSIDASEPIDVNSPLLQSGMVDSLSLLQIVMGLQSEIGVTVELEEINEDNFRDIENIAALISRKV